MIEPDPENSRISEAAFDELLRTSSLGRGMSPEQRASRAEKERLGPFQREFEELYVLGEPSPAQLRRLAELVVILRTDTEARPFWEKAAEAGDRDAIDYLELVREEGGE